MNKIDYKKELKHLYNVSANKIEFVEVPELQYLMIDGKGNPNDSIEFQNSVEALYGLAYTLKFMSKVENNFDYTVMPLEGLWWSDDLNNFATNNKDEWLWTLMIMTPKIINENNLEIAKQKILEKKEVRNLDLVRLESYAEGKSAQLLHIGPYSEEYINIMKIHKVIEDSGFSLTKKHHEIYLSDPRRTAPDKLKTILRQPYK
jgi:hypothetical protein